MRRRITYARLDRVRARQKAADPDRNEARERALQSAADLAQREEWERALKGLVALVVEATGIEDELEPTPYGWRYRHARSAHAFVRSLPHAMLRALFDGDDVSDAHPLHARAWKDPNALSRDEWRSINEGPRVW